MIQLVHIVEGGERSQMSKRKGEFVTLDELIDDIGVDAARWFMVQRSNDTQIDLDLDLARKQSSDNPVYYVQYAHARIASILRKAEAESGWEPSPSAPRRRPRPGWRPPRSPPSARWSSASSPDPPRSTAPPTCAPRTGSAPTPPRRQPTSTPSTATARWSARAATSSRRAWPSAWRRSR